MIFKSFQAYSKKLLNFQNRLPTYTARCMFIAVQNLRKWAIVEHLTGPQMARGVGNFPRATLDTKTGRLRNAMRAFIKHNPRGVSGYLANSVVYAAIHEYGGTIYTRNARIRMPERSYARSTVHVHHDDTMKTLLQGVMKGYKQTR